jgi:hypothetical protein
LRWSAVGPLQVARAPRCSRGRLEAPRRGLLGDIERPGLDASRFIERGQNPPVIAAYEDANIGEGRCAV